MRDLMMIGIALVFTGLLLWFRSLLFKRGAGDLHRVYIVRDRHDDNGWDDSNTADGWPSIIGAEEDSVSEGRVLSADERIELAVMQDRMLRLLR